MNPRNQSFIVTFLLIIAAVAMIVMAVQREKPSGLISLTELANLINKGEAVSIKQEGQNLTIETTNGAQISSKIGPNGTLTEQLSELGVNMEMFDVKASNPIKIYQVEPSWTSKISLPLLTYVLPLLLLFGVFWLLFRATQGSNNATMSFGKSRARMFSGEHPTITFVDVAGQDEAKDGLSEVVTFLKEPQKFIQLGARIPRGVLLIGPPGTGKTFMAKAVSGEAGVPFFSISGSEFVEMFVGVGASRVRDLFDQAKRHSPCIVFVDEIDAVGRARGTGLGGSHDEREQTLNQLLIEMDGFDTDTSVIIMAATNRPDVLDSALLRPGRFDRRVNLELPDQKGREATFKVHMKGKPLASDIDLEKLSMSTVGFSGADIENLINEAAILAAKLNKKSIGQIELEDAIDHVLSGPERKSRFLSPEITKVIAFHEAGHVILAHLLPNLKDQLRKVSVISRGSSAGYMSTLFGAEKILSKSGYEDMLAFYLGGYTAEEIVFKSVTPIGSDDLQTVTDLARTMVTRYGMSETLGPRAYAKRDNDQVFLGRDIVEQREYSDVVAAQIDAEVQKIVDVAHKKAKEIIQANRAKMNEIADELIKVETLDQAQMERFFE